MTDTIYHELVNSHRVFVKEETDGINRWAHTEWWNRNKGHEGTVPVPRPWILVESGPDGEAWVKSHMRVIWSIGPPEQDGEFWLHVSVSRDNDLPITVRPSYQDLATVKAVFVGQERYAYSVWPPTDKHVNIHTGVLHLWSPVTGHERGQALPEFSRGLGTI